MELPDLDELCKSIPGSHKDNMDLPDLDMMEMSKRQDRFFHTSN